MKVVLYAEDREDDVFFLRRACRRAGLDTVLKLQDVSDGQLAIDYLAGQREFADRSKYPLPDLALLDLKMPRRSGLDVLEWIRGQPRFAELPVFLLTSSNQETDMKRASALQANGYFIKPGGIDELARMVEQIATALGLQPGAALPRPNPMAT